MQVVYNGLSQDFVDLIDYVHRKMLLIECASYD